MNPPLFFRYACLLALFVLFTAPASAQTEAVSDTLANGDAVLTLKEINREPKRALLWAIIPGGGQVYNRAWWKVPIVYGGLLGIVAVADYNQTLYNRYVTALEQRCLGDGYVITIPKAECDQIPNDPSLAELPTEALLRARNESNRRRQIAYFAIIGGYAMQAIEAFTDAHLRDFDISDDLSMHFGPVADPATGAGVGVTVYLGTGRGRKLQERAVDRLSR